MSHSLWREEASTRLPELQAIVASLDVKTPSDLWMKLCFEFDRLCHEQPPPIELLSRIWQYARWSADHESEDVQFAAITFFFEGITDTRLYRTILPRFMSRNEYETVCGLRAPGEAQGSGKRKT